MTVAGKEKIFNWLMIKKVLWEDNNLNIRLSLLSLNFQVIQHKAKYFKCFRRIWKDGVEYLNPLWLGLLNLMTLNIHQILTVEGHCLCGIWVCKGKDRGILTYPLEPFQPLPLSQLPPVICSMISYHTGISKHQHSFVLPFVAFLMFFLVFILHFLLASSPYNLSFVDQPLDMIIPAKVNLPSIPQVMFPSLVFKRTHYNGEYATEGRAFKGLFDRSSRRKNAATFLFSNPDFSVQSWRQTSNDKISMK